MGNLTMADRLEKEWPLAFCGPAWAVMVILAPPESEAAGLSEPAADPP
jgi:hypothetical protein